jgi:glyoxylase-like metal-dependent hydrolase (beta-lactamase superfamily II)
VTETIADKVEIRSFADPYFDQNCLIIRRRDTKQALVLDPGLQFEKISDVISGEDLQVQHILVTHGHVDHVLGVPTIKQQTGATVYMHPADRMQFERNPKVIRQFGLNPELFGTPVIDVELEEGKAVEWQELVFDVIHTPGHTQGSVVFLLGERCFGGDTLFRRGVGRTDLPGGSWDALVASIQGKLFQLPPDTVVYPGHGPITTIAEEMRENPFVTVAGL